MLKSFMFAAVVASVVICAVPPASARAAAENVDAVMFIGPAGQARTVTRDDLVAGRRARVTMNIHGRSHVFEGVPLTDLLAMVGAPTGHALRGRELTNVVIVTARDQYEIVLALAETDPGMRA